MCNFDFTSSTEPWRSHHCSCNMKNVKKSSQSRNATQMKTINHVCLFSNQREFIAKHTVVWTHSLLSICNCSVNLKLELAIPNCRRHYWCYHHSFSYLTASLQKNTDSNTYCQCEKQDTILMDSIITQNKGSLIVHISLTDASPFQIKATHHINSPIPFSIKEINVKQPYENISNSQSINSSTAQTQKSRFSVSQLPNDLWILRLTQGPKFNGCDY